MKILGVTALLLFCLLFISVFMDTLQGFSLTKSLFNNISSFKMTTFAESIVILFFILELSREIFLMYKSKKKNPKAGR
ncbi:hypothetical protein [Bacillus vallismortis]|uniref:YczF n=1 Tax=Bacillus vallismortis TaxID=72361 RepID=A0AAP3CIY3_BACVA|nr:hypothetical protein [Bacillus vallismortis]MCY7915969.1 hypothetical protein [Bacillus vallismortis]MCY8309219.1 hypothetical protein [Bacillus vallismortis]MCY8315820.1 hypothetical protein [Bacillus vallismortis]MCY8596192.1 hypothetical protein [Bacillus vallismortis]MEC1650866.1 hypothetical protein [Bacillus vallismortis]